MTTTVRRSRGWVAALLLFVLTVAPCAAQTTQKPPATAGNATATTPVPAQLPADYVIGPDDILTIVFWREKELSGDVPVRPDGRISLPLLNDVEAAGLTPEQLRLRLTKAADEFLEEPTVTVMVKQINSRKVFITGQISKPGPYPLMGPTTVIQLIAMAGGVLEYAKEKNIIITRSEKGKSVSLRFNYDEFKQGKRLEQNIELKPGDTVIVP